MSEEVDPIRSESGSSSSSEGNLSTLGYRLLLFGLLVAALWLCLYALWYALPHVRAGHEQIYDYKLSAIRNDEIFPTVSAPIRVAIFGNSCVQAGFKPTLFDQLSGGKVYSYNLGLPATSSFIAELETLVAQGRAPTHVLLTLPWGRGKGLTAWEYLQKDSLVINDVFPFRHLIRNLLQFYIRSRQNGGLVKYYDHMASLVEQAQQDRGYYFIENQSHFPDHRLPDDFHIESERPDTAWERGMARPGPGLDRLLAVAQEAEIRILVVPYYFREFQYAEAKSSEAEREEAADYGIEILGPDYWRYPNRLFSDPTHLNPAGAEVYTRDLWELVGSYLSAEKNLSTASVLQRGEAKKIEH